ncbi:MAG: hypothetical protein R2828_04115 [Saprospiraceae bacterium]
MRRLIVILRNIWEDLIRHISGPVGIRLRRFYYAPRFQSCGKGLMIASGVYIYNPQYISLGEQVWIDQHTILIAGPPAPSSQIKHIANPAFSGKQGEIHIGNQVHLGIRTIIQGHGGVVIGNHFTSSANVSIFSYSNDPYLCRQGTLPGTSTYYVMTPTQIGHNVWLGLGVSLIGNTIEDDVFIKPHSLVHKAIPANSIAGGNPIKLIGSRFKSA